MNSILKMAANHPTLVELLRTAEVDYLNFANPEEFVNSLKEPLKAYCNVSRILPFVAALVRWTNDELTIERISKGDKRSTFKVISESHYASNQGELHQTKVRAILLGCIVREMIRRESNEFIHEFSLKFLEEILPLLKYPEDWVELFRFARAISHLMLIWLCQKDLFIDVGYLLDGSSSYCAPSGKAGGPRDNRIKIFRFLTKYVPRERGPNVLHTAGIIATEDIEAVTDEIAPNGYIEEGDDEVAETVYDEEIRSSFSNSSSLYQSATGSNSSYQDDQGTEMIYYDISSSFTTTYPECSSSAYLSVSANPGDQPEFLMSYPSSLCPPVTAHCVSYQPDSNSTVFTDICLYNSFQLSALKDMTFALPEMMISDDYIFDGKVFDYADEIERDILEEFGLYSTSEEVPLYEISLEVLLSVL
jgi:hypothetical protein